MNLKDKRKMKKGLSVEKVKLVRVIGLKELELITFLKGE